MLKSRLLRKWQQIELLVTAQVLVTQLAAKQSGYADVVYLDAKTDTYLEEVSSCNIFTVKGRKIKTPPLTVCSVIYFFLDSSAEWSHHIGAEWPSSCIWLHKAYTD